MRGNLRTRAGKKINKKFSTAKHNRGEQPSTFAHFFEEGRNVCVGGRTIKILDIDVNEVCVVPQVINIQKSE